MRMLRLLILPSALSGCTHGPGAIHPDPVHGLEWQVEASSSRRTWAEARQYCQGLELAGTGWRLPTEAELGALYHAAAPEWAAYRGWTDSPEPPTMRNTAASGLYWTASAEPSCSDEDEPPPPIVDPSGVASAGWAWAVAFRTNEPLESHQAEHGTLVCISSTHPSRVRCVRDRLRGGTTPNEGSRP
jgi:hypothetical protein